MGKVGNDKKSALANQALHGILIRRDYELYRKIVPVKDAKGMSEEVYDAVQGVLSDELLEFGLTNGEVNKYGIFVEDIMYALTHERSLA